MSCFIIIHSKQICSPSKQGGSKICQLFKQQSPEGEGGRIVVHIFLMPCHYSKLVENYFFHLIHLII